MAVQPNILFFHVDNLGAGELSCYSGGPYRGLWTRRTDAFAQEGVRLTNYAPEAQCTPTRSALLTGRYGIRSGNHTVPAAGAAGWGLVAWERTLGDLLSAAGYRCAVYGKWHVGEGPGRWPTDHGFDEWYGVPHSYDEALWSIDPWYDPERDPVSTMVEIKKGDHDVTVGDRLTYEHRRVVDVEYKRRAVAFIERQIAGAEPFFVYFNHSMMHLPCVPRAGFAGKTGNGEWADSLLELDSDFGDLLDEIDRLGIRDDTIVVFAGDNGADDMLLWRGSPGFWEGSYLAGGEGNLRTPCIVRWPEAVPAGGTTDEIVHVTDWFTTLLSMAGCGELIPKDRNIDGVDQTELLAGRSGTSAREGYLYWMGDTLYGVKWRNFKLKLVEQKYMLDPAVKLPMGHIVNLVTDPHEREPYNPRYLHTWTRAHFGRLISEFQASLAREPLIPPGASLDHIPSSASVT
ncbi:MAG: sulfatase-like hydrolase/transferase [Chloroflexi bacterium]|nr:sulfatase-like hydrolase/transferase [Chloroflexota bacterium]